MDVNAIICPVPHDKNQSRSYLTIFDTTIFNTTIFDTTIFDKTILD